MSVELNFKSISVHPRTGGGVKVHLRLKTGYGRDDGKVFEGVGEAEDVVQATLDAFRDTGKYDCLPTFLKTSIEFPSYDVACAVLTWRNSDSEKELVTKGPELVAEAVATSAANAVVAAVFTCDQFHK